MILKVTFFVLCRRLLTRRCLCLSLSVSVCLGLSLSEALTVTPGRVFAQACALWWLQHARLPGVTGATHAL